MKLYYSQHTRAHCPRWVLEELGVPFELRRINMSQREHKSPGYLAVHPLGKLPAFEDEGQPMHESGAICMYLADKFPQGALAPPPGTRERGDYYQWCLFGVVTLDEPLITLGLNTQWLPESARQPALAQKARQQLLPILQTLERRLEGREFLVGRGLTVADVLVGSTLRWALSMGVLTDFPGVRAYIQRLMERPAARRAYAD